MTEMSLNARDDSIEPVRKITILRVIAKHPQFQSKQYAC